MTLTELVLIALGFWVVHLIIRRYFHKNSFDEFIFGGLTAFSYMAMIIMGKIAGVW